MNDNGNADKLYKIVIVDDEETIRLGLKYAIQWGEMGFRVVADAGDVASAMDAFCYHHIDVLITDIQMVDETGFDLIHRVRDIDSNIKVVIISGFDNFNYAVEGIRSGASNYLLKPIKKDELIKTFSALRTALDEERKSLLSSLRSQKLADSYFLSHLIQNDYPTQDIISAEMDRLLVELSFHNARILAVLFQDLQKFISDSLMGNIESFDQLISDHISHKYSKPALCSLTTFLGNSFIILCDDTYTQEYIDAVREILNTFHVVHAIGIGSATSRTDFISISYRQAFEDAERRIKKDTDSGVSEENDRMENMLLLKQKSLLTYLEDTRYNEIPALIDSIFSLLTHFNISYLYCWTIDSLHEVVNYFDIDSMKKLLMENSVSPVHLHNNAVSGIIRSSYNQCIRGVIHHLQRLSSSPNQALVRKCCDIIKSEYGNPNFTLYSVADELNISYGYLSTIFKQIIGQRFSDYLLGTRMKAARKMLFQKNKYKMFEIADAVGYKTERYFSSAFRNYFGESPSRFKGSKEKEPEDKVLNP